MGIRVQLRPHKKGVAALKRNGFQVKPVRFSRGNHLIVRVTRGGASCQVTLAGSPSGQFLNALVCAARRGIKKAAAQ